MSDLVERLRDERIWGQTHLRHEAADEIERLRKDRLCRCADEVRCEMRAEIKRLWAVVDAVKDIKWRSIDKDNMEFATTCFVVDRIRIALAALEDDDAD